MMQNIKNSVFGRLLQVLLIGYFFISSINASGTFNGLLGESHSNAASGIVSTIIKKIFKCDGCPEELEDFETKAKSEKEFKNLLPPDYLLPGQSVIAGGAFYSINKDKNAITTFVLISSFHKEIHSPPPEFKV